MGSRQIQDAAHQHHTPNSYPNRRLIGARHEELARLNALLTKTRDELNAECATSANMCKAVELEKGTTPAVRRSRALSLCL